MKDESEKPSGAGRSLGHTSRLCYHEAMTLRLARMFDIAMIVGVGSLLAGCGTGSSGDPASGEIRFNDDAVTNSDPADRLAKIEFAAQSGKKISPSDYVGKKNLVLVFVKGYTGSICPFCSAYTSGLITNYSAISQRDAEVLLVYPVARPDESRHLAEFLDRIFKNSMPAASDTPFPVVLDVGLKAVDVLGIRKDPSKPATYILDRKGHVRFAYVGNSLADRPSIKVILQQLDGLKGEG
jgi:peroxiredoxin